MTDRNTCSGKSKFLLLALVALAVFQPGFAEDQHIEQLRNAAEQGDREAQYLLGVMYYYSGESVPQDYRKAAEWFRMAAEQGLAVAQGSLGRMYEDGKGVPEDDREAVKWYRLAAEQALAEAQDNLGRMYARGDGVPEDYVKGYVWLNLAAAQGNGNAVKGKDLIRPIMTSEQVAESQRLAAELFRRIESSKSE